MGFEWSRDDHIRKIDTARIKKSYAELNNNDDPMGALDRVEREAHAALSP